MLASVFCELSTARSEHGAARRPRIGQLRQDPSLESIGTVTGGVHRKGQAADIARRGEQFACIIGADKIRRIRLCEVFLMLPQTGCDSTRREKGVGCRQRR